MIAAIKGSVVWQKQCGQSLWKTFKISLTTYEHIYQLRLVAITFKKWFIIASEIPWIKLFIWNHYTIYLETLWANKIMETVDTEIPESSLLANIFKNRAGSFWVTDNGEILNKSCLLIHLWNFEAIIPNWMQNWIWIEQPYDSKRKALTHWTILCGTSRP